jgi:hypothetical protein
VAHELLPDALWDPEVTFSWREMLFRTWLAKELASIPSHHIYVETSHLFIKLYADVACAVLGDMGIRLDVIRLRRRDPTSPVVSRWELLHDPRTHPWLYGTHARAHIHLHFSPRRR